MAVSRLARDPDFAVPWPRVSPGPAPEPRNADAANAALDRAAPVTSPDRVSAPPRLTPFAGLSRYGLDVGAEFLITLADDAKATLRFTRANELSVTVDGTTAQFAFGRAASAYNVALAGALSGLTSSAILPAGASAGVETYIIGQSYVFMPQAEAEAQHSALQQRLNDGVAATRNSIVRGEATPVWAAIPSAGLYGQALAVRY